MYIQITQKDIDQGKRCHPVFCPVAIAASRALAKPVSCGYFLMYIGYKTNVKLPKKVTNWICDFDEGIEVRPFEFDINVE